MSANISSLPLLSLIEFGLVYATIRKSNLEFKERRALYFTLLMIFILYSVLCILGIRDVFLQKWVLNNMPGFWITGGIPTIFADSTGTFQEFQIGDSQSLYGGWQAKVPFVSGSASFCNRRNYKGLVRAIFPLLRFFHWSTRFYFWSIGTLRLLSSIKKSIKRKKLFENFNFRGSYHYPIWNDRN